MDWNNKVSEQAEIEAAGIKQLKPFLDRYYAPYRLIPQDTKLQVRGKIDCLSTRIQCALEFKIVTGEYNKIYAEFRGVSDSGWEYNGWAAQPISNTKTHLIYLMTETIYVIDMNKFKSWYQAADKSSYYVSKIRDDKLGQWMYGHLVPVKDFDIIFSGNFNKIVEKCLDYKEKTV
jgi:hypothetical protein